ncbi:F-box/LRR-repeat/kelch-repeat protein At2g27520 [Linum grandiflorum]
MKMSLPEDIQNEILLRADVKTLIRLKAGCKSWNSLVKDPSFISKHMTLQKSSKILLAPGSGESSSSFNSITNFPSVNFVDICSPTDDVVEYIYDSIQFSHTARILTQSCRGLFLVGYYNRNKLEIPQHLAIVNPATKEKRVLPQSDLFHPVSGIAPKVMLYGLGYDSQTNDYGVVRLFDVRLFDMVDQSVTIAELYSMRSNSWREVDIGTAISNVLPLHDASQYSIRGDRRFEEQKMKKSLPEDIQNEILLRADIKTLMRLKAGCKSWNSLVKDPSFISQHMTLHNSSKILLVPGSGESSISFSSLPSFPSSVNLVDITNVVEDLTNSYTARILTQPCQGMFLVEYYNSNNLITPEQIAIVNPATKEKRVLQPQSERFSAESRCAQRVMLYGLGYDSWTNEYSVVRLFQMFQGVVIAELYSTSSDSWRKLDIDYKTAMLALDYISDQYSVYAAGSCHWLLGVTPRIMSFDFRSRMFKVAPIALPTTQPFDNLHILPGKNVDDCSITLVMRSGVFDDLGESILFSLEMWEAVLLPEQEEEEEEGWSWQKVNRMELESFYDGSDDSGTRFCGDARIVFERRANGWVLHDVRNDRTTTVRGDGIVVDDIFVYKERLSTTFVG